MYFYGKIFLLGENFFFVQKKGCDQSLVTVPYSKQAVFSRQLLGHNLHFNNKPVNVRAIL